MGKQIKTVKQYSAPLGEETLRALRLIAKDYIAVKKAVYERYSGVGSLEKIDPGYSVQNEMTASGLRARMGLTSVYFYRAVFDALRDIRMQWQRTREKIRRLVLRNGNLDELERHYLCWVLKHPKVYAKVVQRKRVGLPPHFREKGVRVQRAHNLLCRLTRRHKAGKCQAKDSVSFSLTNRAYKYVPGGIKLSTKTANRRVFIPLTDKNQYDVQLLLQLTDDNRVRLHVPVQQRTRTAQAGANGIALRLGYETMLELADGRRYGEGLGEQMTRETQRLIGKNKRRREMLEAYKRSIKQGQAQKARRILENNLGEKKYNRQKARADARIKGFINEQLNRMLDAQRPASIEIPCKGTVRYQDVCKQQRANLSRWLIGYIRGRLLYKCEQRGIAIRQEKLEQGCNYENFKQARRAQDGVREGTKAAC